MDDDQLLEFNRGRLANWDEERAQRLLVKQPDLYRNHLAIAKWIDGWAGRIQEADLLQQHQEPGYREGLVKGLREIAAHLRQGDLVPGGRLLRRLK